MVMKFASQPCGFRFSPSELHFEQETSIALGRAGIERNGSYIMLVCARESASSSFNVLFPCWHGLRWFDGSCPTPYCQLRCGFYGWIAFLATDVFIYHI